MNIRLLVGAVLLAVAGYVGAQSTTTQYAWQVTNFPLYGVAVTPSDDTDLDYAMAIRADADGAVTAACVGSGAANEITLNLVAGEFFPCQVIRVYDSGTDAITIHGFY